MSTNNHSAKTERGSFDASAFLADCTTKPGVYQMCNAQHKVIYVGKAKNLKKRLSSYFLKQPDSLKTQQLLTQLASIQLIITETENQALLLEASLIKQLKPRYNVIFKDDKSYPYLYLSTDHAFPRLDLHRGARRGRGRYFGPYPHVAAVRDMLTLIQKVFKLRQCSDSFFENRTRPCLQYQIKRCTAPCVGYVSEKNYAEQVRQTELFLEGKNQILVNQLMQQMDVAAQAQRYEAAAQLRDQITALRNLQHPQLSLAATEQMDVIGVACDQKRAAITVLFIRHGQVIGSKPFVMRNMALSEPGELLTTFIPQYYLSPQRGADRVKKVVVSYPLPNRAWIQAALQEQLGYSIRVIDRGTVTYRHWQQLVNANAKHALQQRQLEDASWLSQWDALQTVLTLVNPPQRIECFDVSHTQGEATMASCVVFDETGLVRSACRRYRITEITPGDDYAAMRHVVERRYTRLKTEEQALPDLIVIDGGKGQLRQAAEALETAQVSGVVLLGVAKGPTRKPEHETLWRWGENKPIELSLHSPAHRLLQHIRDEAHRYAITAHRKQLLKKRGTMSPLESIPGVGPKKRQALLRYFGGLQGMTQASVSELTQVPGISLTLAQQIYDALH